MNPKLQRKLDILSIIPKGKESCYSPHKAASLELLFESVRVDRNCEKLDIRNKSVRAKTKVGFSPLLYIDSEILRVRLRLACSFSELKLEPEI